MKISLCNARLNMASKVVLTVFALGLIARIDTAGAGAFARRRAATQVSPKPESESQIEPVSRAEFFAATARTEVPSPELPHEVRSDREVLRSSQDDNGGKIASDEDEILDEFDLDGSRTDGSESCDGDESDAEANEECSAGFVGAEVDGIRDCVSAE